tara:strand:+ start:1786 stop:2580 length:795 start_codon:yes stop_codon:yes gene_type:complete
MFYKKKGLPEENELVVCTVKKILFHSIFAELDEYERLDGMIHISEVAPGRIRNIRDYVKEGKKLVCVVLKVDPVKKHIDLSLRRVSMSLRNKKNEEFRQEMKAEKLLENIAFQKKVKLPEIYKKIGYKLLDKYDLLFPALLDIAANGAEAVKDLKLDNSYEKILVELVQERISPPEYTIAQFILLQSYSPEGVEHIKSTLAAAEKEGKKGKVNLNIVCISAPKYKIEVTADDKKEASDQVDTILKVIEKETKKKDISLEILPRK